MQVGWKADGFAVYYGGASARSSFMLLPGNRASVPGGAHDGTFNEDWAFVENADNLDRCNGAMTQNGYAYFVTNSYSFSPRCLYGTKITKIR